MSVSSRDALRTALLYGLLSVFWLLITDHLLNSYFDNSAQLAKWQLINGYVFALFSAVLIFFARARLFGFLGISPGLKRQRQDQERLRQAAVVFDCTREGVLVSDSRGVIVHVNRALVEITGYSVEEVLGHRPNMFKSGRHGPAFYEAMFKSIDESGDWHGEIWNRRKSGEVYPQWQTVRSITDDKGQITHYVAVFSDISAIKHSQNELARLVHHDPLTDLPNRLLFTDRTEQALAFAQRHETGCALLMIDLDHFKIINDSLGHNIGDLLLKAVADRLLRIFGKGFTVARLGGDEFAVLVDNCPQVAHAANAAQQVLEVMKGAFDVDKHQLFISASIGISVFPKDALNAEQLLRNADSALFKAKSIGREGYALYTEELTAHAQYRIEVAGDLRRALEQQELRVYYQPVHDLHTSRLIGVEALVRWEHPLRGLLSPGEFIPIAERSGLIAEIDAWVLEQACWQMVQWQAAGLKLSFVAVNISSRLFARPELYTLVSTVLADTGLDPSLLRLKRLPVQKLKIDQGFVAGLPGDNDDVAIVRAVIALGQSMGLQVHAEGIEQVEQARFLLDLNCNLGQGYWFGRPMPAKELDWQRAPAIRT